MKGNALELVFILDASGSMFSLTDDTIGGFNSVLDKQKEDNTEVMLTTVLFNSRVSCLHDRLPAAKVAHITGEDYSTGGSTALYDAIGCTIRHIEDVQRYIRPEDVPGKTLFVITTDGMENASHEFSGAQVKEMIEKKKEAGWEFLFLAADIDTYEVAERIGIRRERAASFRKSTEGVEGLYRSVDDAILAMKESKLDAMDWKRALLEKGKEK